MKKSWKTTTAAVCGIIGILAQAAAAALDTNPATDPQWGIVIPSCIGMLTGLFARDNDVSSEQAGAK